MIYRVYADYKDVADAAYYIRHVYYGPDLNRAIEEYECTETDQGKHRVYLQMVIGDYNHDTFLMNSDFEKHSHFFGMLKEKGGVFRDGGDGPLRIFLRKCAKRLGYT